MKNEISLSKLLIINHMFSLYSSIGESVRTEIDIENSPYDLVATRNSISLLKALNFITLRFGRYKKNNKSIYVELSEFRRELLARILNLYSDEIKVIFNNTIHYEEKSSKYYFKRNSIDLNKSGLLMLLAGLDTLIISKSNVYINDESLIGRYKNTDFSNKKMSITQLKEGLMIKDEFGIEAEKLALEYEINLLEKQSINKKPSIISMIDVSAGYDIVSFSSIKSLVPDKFIEVKSCPDHQYRFYMSKNEIATARDMAENYFIYLYNRKTKSFRVIQNPYSKIIQNQNWIKEAQIFEIHNSSNS